MSDFQILPSDFNETTITFVCVSPAAKSRINGASAVQVRKSAAPDFYEQLEGEGYSLETL